MGLELAKVRDLVAREHGLAVVATIRPDGTAQATVVNAGVIEHPAGGEPVVAFVVRGSPKKLENLRARPRATVVFRSGWDWATVEGPAEVVGPDDPLVGAVHLDVPRLLREIYAAAAGGDPDDWRELDQAIAEERHTAVLVRLERLYSNPVEGSPTTS